MATDGLPSIRTPLPRSLRRPFSNASGSRSWRSPSCWDLAGRPLQMILVSRWAAASWRELPGFARPTVVGHGGALRVVSTPTGKIAAIFTGRTHLYEGHGPDRVVHGVRTAIAAGASAIVLTNGCGGLNPDCDPQARRCSSVITSI